MSDDVLQKTPFGPLRGRHSAGVTAFHRVPYSLPRLGESRFQRPGDAPVWTAVRDAMTPGPVPPQLPSRLDGVMGVYDAPQDEDCLHLDIWRPDSAVSDAPVLVFIHGGAFMTGGGSMPCYDGHALARQTGCVVVTVSYRLGILGFMPIPEFGAVNLGLHDQIAALRWVRQAIDAFGGNPQNVTVIGQSAGAFSIAALMVAPVGPSLFDKAILMSAPLGLTLKTAEQSTGIRSSLLRALGHAPDALEQLRLASSESLLAALAQAGRAAVPKPGDVTPPFMPVLDGDLLPRDPLVAIREGAGAWCPTIIGVTREELGAFHLPGGPLDRLEAAQVRALFTAAYGADAPAQLAKARAGRVPASPRNLICDLNTARDFVQPSWEFAAAQQAQGQAHSYAYQLDWQSPMPGLGACHCLDLPFLFGLPDLWDSIPMVAGADRAEVEGLAQLMQGSFARFAATGQPSAPDLPVWPAFGTARTVLHFDRRITALALTD